MGFWFYAAAGIVAILLIAAFGLFRMVSRERAVKRAITERGGTVEHVEFDFDPDRRMHLDLWTARYYARNGVVRVGKFRIIRGGVVVEHDVPLEEGMEKRPLPESPADVKMDDLIEYARLQKTPATPYVSALLRQLGDRPEVPIEVRETEAMPALGEVLPGQLGFDAIVQWFRLSNVVQGREAEHPEFEFTVWGKPLDVRWEVSGERPSRSILISTRQ